MNVLSIIGGCVVGSVGCCVFGGLGAYAYNSCLSGKSEDGDKKPLTKVELLLRGQQDPVEFHVITIDTEKASRGKSILKKVVTSTEGDMIDFAVVEKFFKEYKKLSSTDPLLVDITTCGGAVPAALSIAKSLSRHQGPVVVRIPQYAFSGGTLIALAADTILMHEFSQMGPVDPQGHITGLGTSVPIKDVASVTEKWLEDNPNTKDPDAFKILLAQQEAKSCMSNYSKFLSDIIDTRLKRSMESKDLSQEDRAKRVKAIEAVVCAEDASHSIPLYAQDLEQVLDVQSINDTTIKSSPNKKKRSYSEEE